jgi:hypothetical protein
MIKVSYKGDVQKEVSALIETAEKLIIEKAIIALAQATPVDTGYAQSRWAKDADGNITNDAVYIEELNAGHSKQAPAYFIEQTLLSQPGIIPSGTIVRSE